MRSDYCCIAGLNDQCVAVRTFPQFFATMCRGINPTIPSDDFNSTVLIRFNEPINMSDDNFKAKEITRKPPAPPDPNQKFWDIADSFIQLANENCKGATLGQVCAAMMYATARFNAFTASNDAPSGEAFRKDANNAVAYFGAEFDKMLKENFHDYAENFERYHPEKS
jgi:hypothetical protein